MGTAAGQAVRVFKTTWFAKAARKMSIRDQDLCLAIQQVIQGQAVNLGGGVYKKRMDKNRSRSIILAKGGRRWVFEYLFAKKDRENIDDDELANFRRLAKAYESLTKQQVTQLLLNADWMEICHAS
jgi:hypothetical protein